ncbi:carotenoid 1,2-hydratase [Vibrio sp. ZSDE26]|uniref:Carotenoid 1,2-hydratase n=1 Tax=Vibrio amylolyticus TaxID=2847292 RepID=A0A9X1XRH8_9VIBR|nr:lipocalin-like domain-containing protein [Vibrio amylolyticus]MCK6265810.1 carotenoid 1,2-hydratase [Vibrio amylolyticus]
MKNRKRNSKLSLVRSLLVLLVITTVAALLYIDSNDVTNEANSGTRNAVVDLLQKQVFEPVLPDTAVTLPKDFRFHPEYQHEWWQYFANVVDDEGAEYGIQWSYFRIASDERKTAGWQSPQIYISHVVISSKNKVWKEQRIARGGVGQAGMIVEPFKVWVDNWCWQATGKTPFPGELDISTNEFALNLQSQAAGPFALLGENGYQPKHDLLPIAAFNISAPFISVKGEITLGDNKTTRVKGNAWMSKEWGSQLISQRQKGWDWFVVRLNESEVLTVSQYRHEDQMPYVFGSIISNSGKTISLDETQISLNSSKGSVLKGGKRVPLEWDVIIPQYDINLALTPVNKNLLLPFIIPYWEGPIEVRGSHNGKGFMQLTGY